MDVYHRIGFNPRRSPGLQEIIERLGISYRTSPLPGYEVGLIYFDIYESDSAWPELHRILKAWPVSVSNRFDTIFDEEEILAAAWLRLVPVKESGYLKPETPKWRSLLYEGYCKGCGAYDRQKSPIQMSKAPRRPKGSFVSPIGPYVLMCSPQMEGEMQAAGIYGYEVWPVLRYRKNEAFENTIQLYIPRAAQPGLTETEGLSSSRCLECGRVKYQPHMRGIMYFDREAFARVEGLDIFHSFEWFGSGHAAYREIIISNRFARLILEKKWKGVRMKVIELV